MKGTVFTKTVICIFILLLMQTQVLANPIPVFALCGVNVIEDSYNLCILLQTANEIYEYEYGDRDFYTKRYKIDKG